MDLSVNYKIFTPPPNTVGEIYENLVKFLEVHKIINKKKLLKKSSEYCLKIPLDRGYRDITTSITVPFTVCIFGKFHQTLMFAKVTL